MGALIAAAAVAAVGAGASAYGASQNASATRDAAKMNSYLAGQFAKNQNKQLDLLIADKEDRLGNLSTILDEYSGGAAFGSSDVLANIRKAQSDYASLAAGDFTAFESQLNNLLSANLANTYGSGAAAGVFENLSANTLAGLRQQGLSNAISTGQALASETYNILGLEFGIMDQRFQTQYEIGAQKLAVQSGAAMQAASQAGVGMSATGQALSSIGSSFLGAYQGIRANNYQDSMLGLAQQNSQQQGQLINAQIAAANNQARYFGGNVNTNFP